MAAGLLSRSAWRALESADRVLISDPDSEQGQALQVAGIELERGPAAEQSEVAVRALARELLGLAEGGQAILWVGSADGDPGLADALAAQASAGAATAPEIEVVVGSWDVTGGRLLDAVAVMDRLRSPGGCPWDAEQTHASLLPYLVEEAHELIDAVESGDQEQVRDELGDVLLQVLFHARVASDDADQPFGIDDVAGALVAKLVRRHPHVFADVQADDAAAVEANWEQIKAGENPERRHPLDGVPASMPELATVAKVISRLERAGLGPWLQIWLEGRSGVGAGVVGQAHRAHLDGVDVAAAVRAEMRALRSDVPVTPAGQR